MRCFHWRASTGGNREYDEAIKDLTRAIRVDPDYAQGTGLAQRGRS